VLYRGINRIVKVNAIEERNDYLILFKNLYMLDQCWSVFRDDTMKKIFTRVDYVVKRMTIVRTCTVDMSKEKFINIEKI
jgi:hypothetical protein